MDKAVLTIISQFGIIPTIIILIMVVWFLLREIKKEVRTITDSYSSLRYEISQKLDELKEHSDERDRETAELVEQIRRRLESVEREYVTREDHYQALGGWREEMREIRAIILKEKCA